MTTPTDPTPAPLPAGRQLDALVAERVFGYAGVRLAPDHPWTCLRNPTAREVADYAQNGIRHDVLGVDHYSTDIAAAWQVVNALRQRRLYLQMNDTMSRWRARFFTVASTRFWDRESADGAMYEFAETLPHAICLAALAAVEAMRAKGQAEGSEMR
jgi:hypothetical protein